jgi:hypothetical protein
MINLCECKPGDYLISRNGWIYTYSHVREYGGPGYHLHVVLLNNGNAVNYNDDGSFSSCRTHGIRDIVKIIPQETQNIYFALYENKKKSKLL